MQMDQLAHLRISGTFHHYNMTFYINYKPTHQNLSLKFHPVNKLAVRKVRLHKLDATFVWAESRAGWDSPHQVSAGVVTCHPVGSLEGL